MHLIPSQFPVLLVITLILFDSFSYFYTKLNFLELLSYMYMLEPTLYIYALQSVFSSWKYICIPNLLYYNHSCFCCCCCCCCCCRVHFTLASAIVCPCCMQNSYKIKIKTLLGAALSCHCLHGYIICMHLPQIILWHKLAVKCATNQKALMRIIALGVWS